MTSPNLDLERELLGRFDAVIGIDEVGRGALAGPVGVGAFLLTRNLVDSLPASVKDSKLISEKKRSEVAEEVRDWGQSGVGFCSPATIDEKGITFSLKAAAMEAIANLETRNAVILLDGSHNWLGDVGIEVLVRTRADRDCGSVAAASVVAKVRRDEVMKDLALEFPQYGWESNKGYSSPSHIQAIQSLGPSPHHRKTWLEKILAQEQGLF